MGYTLIGLAFLITQVAHAQTVRPRADTYWMPSDVQPTGGGEAAKSTLYRLDDTIGESNIGFGRSNTYDINAGYRQVTVLAFACDDAASLGTIAFAGQKTATTTCSVITDADAGYALSWRVTTGSGGTNTGYLINEIEDVIAPFDPTVEGTPQTWTVADVDARWGGRLSSASDDTDVKWGTDNASEKWLNVGTGSYTIVTRSSRTEVTGSSELVQFRAEVGAQKIQSPGTYRSAVEITAAAL